MTNNYQLKSLCIIILLSIFIIFMYLNKTTNRFQVHITAIYKSYFQYNDVFNETDKLQEYYRIHERVSYEKASLRKISFNGYTAGGYGNKLYSFLSSLVVAILTDSHLVVRWSDIDKYIEPPIRIFENVSIDVGLNSTEFKNNSLYLDAKQAWSTKKTIDILMNTSVPTDYLRYFYNSIKPLFMEICANPKYFATFLHYNLVSNETVSSALKAISNKKSSESEKQNTVFRVGFEVGGNLLNKVWTPIPSIMKDINYYLDKEFRGHFVIGIQLRYGDPGNPYLHVLNDTRKFINCALDIEKVYAKQNITRFKWFIASDSEKNSQALFLAKYPNKTFTTSGVLTHVAHNSSGYRRTILDVELLSRCNESIITGGSTFGWISSMKRLQTAFYINGFSTMKKCLRAEFSQPPKTSTGSAVFR